MDGAMLARLGAVIFVAIAGTAAIMEMSREERTSETAAPIRTVEATRDPLRDGLRRCQQMGEAAASVADCLNIWAAATGFWAAQPRQKAPEPWAALASSTTSWGSSPPISTAALACLAARSPSSPLPLSSST